MGPADDLNVCTGRSWACAETANRAITAQPSTTSIDFIYTLLICFPPSNAGILARMAWSDNLAVNKLSPLTRSLLSDTVAPFLHHAVQKLDARTGAHRPCP